MKSPGEKVKKNSLSRQYNWKRRPSEIRGYSRVLYTTTERGDYIRVDYHIKDKKVRLYIEDSEEDGNPFYSVIVNGNVTVERNSSTGRIVSLFEKFNKRAGIISTIPNKDVLKLINRNYGIGVKKEKKGRESEAKKREKENLKKSELEETRRKYFRPEYVPVIEKEEAEAERERKRLVLQDFFDILIGGALCAAVYFFTYNLLTTGVISALIGILFGFIDVFIRKKDPFFIKIIIFIIAGMAVYIYGYYFI